MLRLPRHNDRDLAVLLWTMIPFSILLNFIMFGKGVISNWHLLFLSTPITFLILGSTFVFYGYLAAMC